MTQPVRHQLTMGASRPLRDHNNLPVEFSIQPAGQNYAFDCPLAVRHTAVKSQQLQKRQVAEASLFPANL